MEIYEVNLITIIFSALASILLGFLWYGPLFGKKWIKLMDFNKKDIDNMKKKSMGLTYILMIFSSLISVTIIGLLVKATDTTQIFSGVLLGFYLWLGFIATYSLGSVLWENKSWDLWIFNNSYQLISIQIITYIMINFA